MVQCEKNMAVRTWTTVTMENAVASLWKDFTICDLLYASHPSTDSLEKKFKINFEFMYNKNFMCHRNCSTGTALGSSPEPHLLESLCLVMC